MADILRALPCHRVDCLLAMGLGKQPTAPNSDSDRRLRR